MSRAAIGGAGKPIARAISGGAFGMMARDLNGK
jgi:hypothetical protein